MIRVAKNLIIWICFCSCTVWVCSIALAERPLPPVNSENEPPSAQPQNNPDSWCPAGRDLDLYLDARKRLPVDRGAEDLARLPASPVVSFQDGVLLIEDAGVILRNDRIFDLPMESIEFVPAGDGYQVSVIPSAYEPVTGQVVFTGADGWIATQVLLGAFRFPFGGEERTTFWVTSTNMISFEPPTEPVKVGLCTQGCYFDEGQVLLDRLPRISPLQHGSFLYGQNAYIQGGPDRAVITWQYADPANLDVQVVLFPDGRIRLNYAAVSGIGHGAPVVVTGNEAFWGDLRLGGETDDPAGDLSIPAPDGPAIDLLGATARQVGTSELLQVEFTVAAPPSANQEMRIFYQIELRDHAGDPEPLSRVLLQWQRGSFYYVTDAVTLEGNTMRLNLRLWDLPLSDNNIHLTFSTFRGDEVFEDGDSMELTATYSPLDSRMMLDLTEDLPITMGDRPIYEAFTYPSLQPGEVLEALSPLFEDPSDVEAFAIFQNLWTDLWFFGGGYHAGGNSGADGIGFGSSTTPRSPSLLHLNNIYSYDAEDWNMTVLNHEFGHRWLYHFEIEEEGSPSRILNPVSSHPAGWVHTPAVRPVYKPNDYSVMGGSYWRDQLDGTFHSTPELRGGPNGYSWHELYLIGLADPDEVADWWYIRNPSPSVTSAYWPPNDIEVSGEHVPVSIDQVIAVEGARYPAYPDSLQHFLAPMVLVVRPGALTDDEIVVVNDMCTLWETRFQEATDFRGSLRCRFQPPSVSITSPATDVFVWAGDSVDFEGAATDGDGDEVELRWRFPGVAPDATASGPHTVSFVSTGVYTILLDGVDETGMLATHQDTLQVTVQCPTTPPADEVQDLRLDKEGTEIRFTWIDLVEPPTDYVLLSNDDPQGNFLPEGAAPSGTPGFVLPSPDGTIVYYKVAARQDPGCLGPF